MPQPRPRLSERILEELTDDVRAGRLPVGDRLPTETALADRFGVSRPIVREALARLREEGMLVTRQGAGTFVARPAQSSVPIVAPLASVADMQACFEMRLAVESDAAFHAATRRDADDLDALSWSCDAMRRANEDVTAGGEEDFAFHHAVAKASGNRFYLAIMEQIRSHMLQGILVNRALKQGQDRARVERVLVDHEAIRMAIADQDPEAACQAMHQHLSNARGRVFEGTQ